MKKILLSCLAAVLLVSCFVSKKNSGPEKDKDKYDNPWARAEQEFEKTKDPALGYVPYNRLVEALLYTEELKRTSANRTYLPLQWEERGPIYDSVGPSNGNGRGGGTGSTAGGYTSGRIRAFLLDTLNDPTGNTAFTGGVAGGVWRCTNFLSSEPNWTKITDFFSNLAIGSICQDPTNPQIIYVATGEATSNADAVFGNGVYKSTDGGLTFHWLPSTANFLRNYKIECDAQGNVYLACRVTTVPVMQTQGLFRSKDGGATWEDITPNNLTSLNNTCTDFVITASGKLNAVFGYVTGTAASTAVVNHRYTNDPANVTPSTWLTGTGFRASPGVCRTGMAVSGEVIYAITINASYNTDSCWRSLDGGVTWTKQNSTVLPSGLGSQQGWYNLCLAINPNNTNELIAGGLDAYRSTNGGATWTRFTYWVTSQPYVHADHHYHMYWIKDGQTRLIMATDGGIFYSTNNGSTFVNKNKNLGIKQFYSAAIHPAAGSPYLIGGTQDNGVHQIKLPGLTYSIEVTGGDGCFTHINQLNPNIQYGSYVYNQYRRSTNGGNTWSSVNLSSSVGLFVNPFDSDDAQNIIYCSNGPLSQIRRWTNSHNSSTNTSLQFSAATLGSTTVSLTAIKVSPYTPNRVFFGTNNGRVFRLDNANTVTTATIDANTTQISSSAFPLGTINCVNVGTSDDYIIAVYTNYGVRSVWFTNDGGATWSDIEGNLPDMPVRWAMFEPGDNNKIYLATDAGIYTTTNIDGANTQWLPESTFPAVRTDMLKIRMSDSTIVAGTHGRGLWTAKIPACVDAQIDVQPTDVTVCEGDAAAFSVSASGSGLIYQWQVSTNGGLTYNNIIGATAPTLNLPATNAGMNGYRYRCIMDTYCSGLLTTNEVTLTVHTRPVITSQSSDITVCAGASHTFSVSATGTAIQYQWQLSTNNGVTYTNIPGANSPTLQLNNVSSAMNGYRYRCVVSGACTPDAVSNGMTLFVNTPPAITTQPASVAICPGNDYTLSAPATGSLLTYQWQVSTNGGATFTNIAGATFPNYTISGITTAQNNYQYRVVISGACPPSVTSNAATLTVYNPVTITTQPANANVCAGVNVTFHVASAGSPTPQAYQWQVSTNGGVSYSNIVGANSSSLTLNNVTTALNNNRYRVLVTGYCGTATSNAAVLTVNGLTTASVTALPARICLSDTLVTLQGTPQGGVWSGVGVIGNNFLPNRTAVGTYTLTYTFTNSAGCSSTASVTAKVEDCPERRRLLRDDAVILYPNPNNGTFSIRINSTLYSYLGMKVYDASGKLVHRQNFSGLQYGRVLPIDLRKLAAGVYNVTIFYDDGVRTSGKTFKVVIANP